MTRAEAAQAFVESRPGKRIAHLSLDVERAWKKTKRCFRLIVQVTERTIDKKGQCLLVPQIELAGWRTTLALPIEAVIDLYRHHGTHEQFHSEFRTDLDLERLPSGKFDTNDVILHLAAFAYNCLRLLGPLGLTGEIAPSAIRPNVGGSKRCCRRSCTGPPDLSPMPGAGYWTSAGA